MPLALRPHCEVDKSLPKALEEEFNNLSSNRPEEFEKILDALDKYGAYELDDLKIMPKEDVEKFDIKPFHKRSLMRYIEKLKVSEYDLDRSMCTTLRIEFVKLYSDRPHEFEKLLHALNRYGAYDLGVLREMPEEDVKKLDIKPPQRRDLMRFIKELNDDAGYDLDESLHKALGREFEKLSSNQPDKFEKLLRILNQYGVYDLYAFKKMSEEDVEKLDVKSFQKGELKRYIKKLNGGNGVPASSEAIGNRSSIQYYGPVYMFKDKAGDVTVNMTTTPKSRHEAQYRSESGLRKRKRTSAYSPRKDVEFIKKPEQVSDMEDEKSALSEKSEEETSIETHDPSKLIKLELQSESDSSRKDVEGVEISQDVNQIEDGIPDQDQNLAEVLEQKIKTEVVREQTIGPEGGIVENLGCKITFPVNAVEKESKIKTSMITDFSGAPEGKAPITPILQCLLDSNLKASVLVEMHSWACPSESEEQEQGQLYKKDEGSHWKFVELVSLSSDSKISFYTQHFTKFAVFVKVVGRGMQTLISLPKSRPGEAAEAASIGIQVSLGLKISIKAFLHINREGQVAFVCCLSHAKLIEDVKASFQESGHIHGLLMPERRRVSRGGKLTVAINCRQPDTLEILDIRDDVESTVRGSEWDIEVSELLKETQHIEYFTLKIEGGNLASYVGEVEVLFSLKNDGSIARRLISKQWPILARTFQITRVLSLQLMTHGCNAAKSWRRTQSDRKLFQLSVSGNLRSSVKAFAGIFIRRVADCDFASPFFTGVAYLRSKLLTQFHTQFAEQ